MPHECTPRSFTPTRTKSLRRRFFCGWLAGCGSCAPMADAPSDALTTSTRKRIPSSSLHAPQMSQLQPITSPKFERSSAVEQLVHSRCRVLGVPGRHPQTRLLVLPRDQRNTKAPLPVPH
ncbi:uncharacterized protein Tco025E_07725 [Trypanosoma conorhini]|uniref:Uncharacterized protein n=1 Tax=Trypanosoma conorhini TaxID=83891 RepID=A0A422NJU3_9TRYP|nr:uncharacterized protein Tco025E_07725 [Trypanosoma conorhini]RNF05778.1 hypothetical protein Tco025E_07725 [Trypanosoma conorhini]